MGVSWPVIDGIIKRAVTCGLDRRGEALPDKICVDEVSDARHHPSWSIRRPAVRDIDGETAVQSLSGGFQ